MDMNRGFLRATVALMGSTLVCMGSNPLFFGADPSALVAPDGCIWIYPTTDEPVWDDQVNWHAWSSTNLVDWTDHGVLFSNTNSGWGINNAWAPDCTYRNGKNYLFATFNAWKEEFLRLKNGALAMLWSSHTPEHQYAQAIAYSPSCKLAGPWEHEPQPVLWDDRGHGMIFSALAHEGNLQVPWDGKLLLVLHRYFQMPKTRVQIFEVDDTGDRLKVGKQILGSP